MKKLLIVGASSFIGANLAMRLRKHYQVYGTFHHHRPQLDQVPLIRFNINRKSDTAKLCKFVKPDVILYCVEVVRNHGTGENEESNHFLNSECACLFAQNLTPSTRMIFFSTAEVFSGAEGNYDESFAPEPVTGLGQSKLIGERFLRNYPSCTTVRLGSVFGIGSFHQQGTLSTLLKRLRKNEKFDVAAHESRSFVPIESVTRITQSIIEDSAPESVVHIGGNEALSYYQFAEKVADTFGYSMKGVSAAQPPPSPNHREGAPRNFSLNSDAAMEKYGITFPSISEGLKDIRTQLSLGQQ